MDDHNEVMTAEELLARMRQAPVLAGPLPGFDPERADDTPGPLFARWLAHALDTGVPEPHVMTLSTADAEARPSARVLMLRGVDIEECGFVFASDAGSRKGRELTANPYAALSWYWPLYGRQIRMAGRVAVQDGDAARRDFLGRGEASRISGFTGRMSEPLAGPDQYETERRRAAGLVADDPQAVPEGHTVYVLRADEAEFFQGDSRGFHVRLRYVREEGGGWTRDLLWP
ncbi:MAG: pyridoxamine 5-phosphate oxidase [Streptomycetaceae bacterium]|nr:pyridoxamine 5-phosphate oxidase [Streptomycetaceae bacterium]